MCRVIFLASDAPLPALPNPHLKLLSVNEALAQGLTVPQSMLEDYELDRDEPGTFLWSDIEVAFDPLSEAMPPEPADNFDIWPVETADGLPTALPHLAEVEWSGCTDARAEILLDYIRRQAETAARVELWSLPQDGGAALRVCREEVPLAALTAEKLAALCAPCDGAGAPLCLCITG